MKYSNIALKLLAAKECGLFKTNAQFWTKFADKETFIQEILNNNKISSIADKLANDLYLKDNQIGIICTYDDCFPFINRKVKNNKDKPYLLFYKGNLSLLKDLNKNIAIIGLTNPDEEIIRRETDIIRRITKNGLVVVSGLAIGCDTVAHKTALETNGKTIAILPSPLDKIYPLENRDFAKEIIKKDGLLISEYYKEPVSKYEAINRFLERDRLQAMFSKAIILISSYRKGEGDSGSRHAMEAARKYEIERYVMYNSRIDKSNKRFGLNKDLLDTKDTYRAKILMSSSIDLITSLKNPNLSSESSSYSGEQIGLL